MTLSVLHQLGVIGMLCEVYAAIAQLMFSNVLEARPDVRSDIDLLGVRFQLEVMNVRLTLD